MQVNPNNQIMSFHIVDPNLEWKSDKLIKENKYDEWISNLIHTEPNVFSHIHTKDGQIKFNPFLFLYFKDFAITYGTGLYQFKSPKTKDELIKLMDNFDFIQQQYNNVGLEVRERYFMTDDFSQPRNPILFTDIQKGINFLKERVEFKTKYIKVSFYISQENNIYSNNLLDFMHDKNDHYLCYQASLIPFI